MKKLLLLTLFTLYCNSSAADPDDQLKKEDANRERFIALKKKVSQIKREGIINWHKDAECQLIFFTVLEGLYRDGVSDEIVDIVIGKVQKNDLKKNFVFQCKLCHATYEAFALYQKRPKFHGVDIKTFGKKKFSSDIVKKLSSNDPQTFGDGLSEIVQPWVKAKLISLDTDESFLKDKLQRFADLAAEGNMINNSYMRCQACEAIKSVGEIINNKKNAEQDSAHQSTTRSEAKSE